eukprot:1805189-Pyramimonas_sp.AAC.1
MFGVFCWCLLGALLGTSWAVPWVIVEAIDPRRTGSRLLTLRESPLVCTCTARLVCNWLCTAVPDIACCRQTVVARPPTKKNIPASTLRGTSAPAHSFSFLAG